MVTFGEKINIVRALLLHIAIFYKPKAKLHINEVHLNYTAVYLRFPFTRKPKAPLF